MPTSPAPTDTINDLRALVRGSVITTDDPGYDDARKVVPGGIDRRPLAIVRVADAADIAEVLRVARETGLPLAVRSGGHSGAGHGVVDDGLVIDLRDLDGLEIDVEGRTAWAGSGLTAFDYTTKVGEHGLATGFGDTGSVGLGGITLGGGIGFLVRAFGMTIDSLLAADIVTADGELLRVDAALASRPLLGDPRRRRQLRGRDPVPAAAAPRREDPGRAADPARDPGDGRRVHRRRRGGTRDAVRRSPTSCPARRCRSSRRSSTGRS